MIKHLFLAILLATSLLGCKSNDIEVSSIEQQVEHLMEQAKECGPEIQSIAEKIASKHGGKVTPINYKSKASILRKMETDKCGIDDIKDAVRNTIIIKKEGIPLVIKDLELEKNWLRTKVQKPEDFMGYSGNIINIKGSNNLTAEIQVNTPKMIYAKEKPAEAKIILGEDLWNKINKEIGLEGGLGHTYYEEWRVLDPISTQAKAIAQKMQEYYSHFQ